ncbi:MAG: hypothetical protein IKZ99_12930 [Salinivirgaceae bacterium]|nr:hypothetical protein [Salinivirgaceae bacterium]
MKTGQKDTPKIVAFIDLLGTKDRYNNDIPIDEALTPIDSYNTILSQKLNEYLINPPDTYEEELQESAKMRYVDSFDYFLPASDSIFLMSRDCNSFIKQLGNFVLDSFILTAGYYRNSKGKSKIEEISDGHCWYPPLFRGGIAYDSARLVDIIKIVNGGPSKTEVLAGKAICNAVKLETMIKGPRLVFERTVYDRLDDNTREYCRTTPEKPDLYEILWPAFIYSPNKDIDEMRQLLIPALNFWKAYNHKDYSSQYFNFIELIVASTIQFFDKKCQLKSLAIKKVSEWLSNNELQHKIEIKNY